MKWYADLPGRRELQLAGDLGLAAWVVVWIWLAGVVHAAVMELATPGRELEAAGSSLGDRLAAAGRSQVEAIHTMACRAGRAGLGYSSPLALRAR